MGAISLGIINETTELSGGVALLPDGDLREQAAERLAEEMSRAARAYERMTGRLGLVLESDKTRRRAAWSCGAKQRMQPPAG